MKCRRLAEIMPELVSGELDEITAREAGEHIRRCTACASEREKYEKSLGALERFQISAELPAALDRLDYSLKEPRHTPILHWVPAAGAAAAILMVVALLLWSVVGHRPDTPVKNVVVKRDVNRIVRSGPKITTRRLPLMVDPVPPGVEKWNPKASALNPSLFLRRRWGFHSSKPRQLRPLIRPRTLLADGQHIANANNNPAPVSVEQVEAVVEYVDSGSLPVVVQQNDVQVAAPPIPILSYQPHGPVLATREYMIENGNRRIGIYYQIDANKNADQGIDDNKIKEP